MADNIAITAGTGTTVATDDVAGTHYQRVKLVDGTLDGTAAIGGDATNGLDVDVTRVQGSVTVAQTTAANLNVTEASAAAIKTAVELIDDTVYTDGTGTPSKAVGIAGTDGTNPQIVKTDAAGELQIDVLSIAAGDNNIGNVDLASAIPAGTNNIGDVDVLTLPAGTVAGSSSLPAGTNNIGDVDVLTLPAGTVAGASSLPAGTNNIGDVDIASIATGAGKTIAYANIDTATSGDNTIVAADASNKIKVISYVLVSTSALSVRWKSGATNKSGAMALAANGGISIAGSPMSPLLETAVNEALILNLSAATQVSGHISYWKEA